MNFTVEGDVTDIAPDTVSGLPSVIASVPPASVRSPGRTEFAAE